MEKGRERPRDKRIKADRKKLTRRDGVEEELMKRKHTESMLDHMKENYDR